MGIAVSHCKEEESVTPPSGFADGKVYAIVQLVIVLHKLSVTLDVIARSKIPEEVLGILLTQVGHPGQGEEGTVEKN